MISFLKKVFQSALILTLLLFAKSQSANAQSIHDSLRQILDSIHNQTRDDKLKQAINEVNTLYTEDYIDDSLSKKLTNVEELLLNTSNISREMMLSFAQILTSIFKPLPPAGEHDSYAFSLNCLGILYQRFGLYDDALISLQNALTINRKIKGMEHRDNAAALNNISGIYFKTGKFTKALELQYEISLNIKKTYGEQSIMYATTLNNQAVLYFTMGYYDKALPLHQAGIKIMKSVVGEEHPQYARVLNNIAILFGRIGQTQKALPLLVQVIAIEKKALGEEHLFYIQGLHDLAELYVEMKEYQKALPLFIQVLNIRKKVLGEQNTDYVHSLNSLATLYKILHEDEKAIPLFDQALNITSTIAAESSDMALILGNLAGLYENRREYEKAFALYQRALVISETNLGNEHPLYISNLINLASVFIKKGLYQDAFALYLKASNREVRRLIRIYSTLSEQEKMALLSDQSHKFDYLPSMLFTYGSQPGILKQIYSNELLLKGMVLENQVHMLRSIRQSGDSSNMLLYDRWHANKLTIGKQLLLPISERMRNLDSLQEITNEQEQELSRNAGSINKSESNNESLTVKDISQALTTGQGAVEFFRFKLYRKNWTDSTMYGALITLPGDTICKFVPLCEENQLNHLIRRAASRSLNTANDSLYNMIWKPLEKCLTDVRTIYYAPAGLLHQIAFQSLRSGKKLLVDKYQLNQMLSTRSVAIPVNVRSKPATAGFWGNINYSFEAGSEASNRGVKISKDETDSTASSFNFYTSDTRGLRGQGWKPLPGTKQEISSLNNLFLKAGISITIDSGAVATEEAFKNLNGKSPTVLHLATHGFFLPVPDKNAQGSAEISYGKASFTTQQNPMFRSGLVLSGGNHAWKGKAVMAGSEDGILTAYEIAQMDLSNTDLVVLSACETALGDIQGNEGVIGLQRAFKMAGVKQMIVSLWRIPDKETTELMTMFYRNWLNGQSTREALRSAQMKMKEKYPPYYWAAFVLVE